MLFEDRRPLIVGLLHVILDEVNTYKPVMKYRNKIWNIGKPPVSKYPRIFFDGAAAKGIGGAGFCIYG